MATLSERLQDLMREMGWTHADLMRVSRQSSSVVSQWLGHGSKEIKTIGKLEAAIYLERASGFSALWLAKGLGPKRVSTPDRFAIGEPSAPAYGQQLVLDQLGQLLRQVAPSMRSAFADILAGWALSPADDSRREALLALLNATSSKLPRAAGT